MREYPHQMSGGMRQRIVGAIALSGGPKLIIADEPTTNLDVTIQAQYLDLLKELQQQTGVAVIFVTHNLGIVARMCEKLAVMYAGRIVEAGTVRELFNNAQHPYTKALLGSMPKLGSKEKLSAIPGQPPDLASLPGGCAFHPRCPDALPRCASDEPGETILSPVMAGKVLARGTASRRSAMPSPLLEVESLTKHFAVNTGSLSASQDRLGESRRRHRFRDRRGRDAGGHRRIRLWQDDDIQADPAPGKAERRQYPLRRSGHWGIRWAGADALPARGPGRLSGPVQFAQPAHAGRRNHCRAATDTHRQTRAEQYERVSEVLELVGMRPDVAKLFPHEFSGGQRQRIAIARALVTDTRLIVLDEPVSALDVSIRAQIMNQLEDLQQQLGVSYLFIGHDLATVAHISHRIAVMYLGQIVELADSTELCHAPLHPYTQALFTAALPAHPDDKYERLQLAGEVPSALAPPSGCRFHPRCPHAMPRCAEEAPVRKAVAPGHTVACHLY